MSTTHTTTARSQRRTPVPLLLESFPVPPTHIPPTPTNVNPPPTGPPSVPLPPVPGPSRISEHEQLLLLGSLGNRSQRLSKYSVNSRSARDSVISVSSNGHGSATAGPRTSVASSSTSASSNPSPLPSTAPSSIYNRDSIASSRSTRSSPRSPSSLGLGRPTVSLSASSAGGRQTPSDQLTRLSMSPMPLSDIEDDDERAAPLSMPSPTLGRTSSSLSSRARRRHYPANESISEIDVSDILGMRDDDGDRCSEEILPPSLVGRRSHAASEFGECTASSRPVTQPSSPTSTSKPMAFPTHIGVGNFSLPSSSKHSPINSLSLNEGSTPALDLKSLSRSTSATHRSVSTTVEKLVPLHAPLFGRNANSNGAGLGLGMDSASMSTVTLASITSTSTASVNSVSTVSPPVEAENGTRKTAKELHTEMRAERSRSAGHKRVLDIRSRSRSRPREESLAEEEEAPPLPTTSKGKNDEMTLDELGSSTTSTPKASVRVKSRHPPPSTNTRVPSPDIATMLRATPRPALSKSVSSSSNNTTWRRPRVKSTGIERRKISNSSSVGPPAVKRRVSEGIPPSYASAKRISSQSDSGSLNGHGPPGKSDLAYLRRMGSVRSAESAREEEGEFDPDMERVLEGAGSEAEGGGDSDSSLDLHTPLPHLMVRHGLLSPNSKLLPHADSRSGTPYGQGPDGRPGSTMSMMSNAASVMTKSGVIKDERDTPMRRTRHRDGRLLRGGIGLTTGLGWSDSEDEDAPSPLTRRLSTLNLSRRSSASSIRTNQSLKASQHPLSRSYSSGALLESEREYDDAFDEFDDDEEDRAVQQSGEWAQHNRRPSGGKPVARSTLPPTSWQRKTTSGTASSARTSTSSVASSLSADSRTPSRLRMTGPATNRESTGSSSVDNSRLSAPGAKRSSGEVNTPTSTASTLSIPMPLTPKDNDLSTSLTSPALSRLNFDKDKNLPPLPAGGLKKSSASRTVSSNTKYTFPRARTFSSTSGGGVSNSASTPAPSPHTPAATPVVISPASPISPKVRPLQLPRQSGRTPGDRPAVPVPLVISPSTSYGSLRTAPLPSPRLAVVSASSSAGSPPPSPLPATSNGVATPRKPRTGTGMVYRTSSHSSMGSKMRLPMQLSASSSTTGGGAARAIVL